LPDDEAIAKLKRLIEYHRGQNPGGTMHKFFLDIAKYRLGMDEDELSSQP
jgi:hypothetical protein